MSCKQTSLVNSLIAAAAFALTGSGAALADDSSMSMWTGDSYAYFNNLDNNPGKFNTARAPHAQMQNPVASPRKEQGPGERRVLLAQRPSGTVMSPFRDDKGA